MSGLAVQVLWERPVLMDSLERKTWTRRRPAEPFSSAHSLIESFRSGCFPVRLW